MTPARWHQLMSQWRAPESDAEFRKLRSAYSEPHRHYHTNRHIDDCLAQLDEVSHLAHAPEEIEAALWFHDAIYKPTSSTNELDSADWASQFLTSVGGSDQKCARVHRHIMATRHTGESLSGDMAIVVDIDVSVLGRNPDVYDQYEKAIRKEYRWVPGPIFRRKRIEVLESFLKRQVLYDTEYFRSRYEEQARSNLRRAIMELQS